MGEKYGDLEGDDLAQALEDVHHEYVALLKAEIERIVALGWSEVVPQEQASIQQGDTGPDRIPNVYFDGEKYHKITLTRETSGALFSLRDEYHWLYERHHGTPHPSTLEQSSEGR